MTAIHAFFSPGIRRAAVLIVLTVLLHVLVLEQSRPFFSHLNTSDAPTSAISVTLRPLEPPRQPVSLPTVNHVKPRVVRKPAPPRPPPAPVAPTENTLSAVTLANTPEVAPASTDIPAEVTTGDSPVTAANGDAGAAVPAQDTASPGAPEGTHYEVAPPPSAELEYAVRAFSDNLNWYGTGKLAWATDGTHYSVTGEVYTRLLAKFSFLNFTSTGDIDAFGVAPELYTEKKRNRAATNTHFNRERNVVSFSASTTTYPRVGGEQDRASLIWQLAAIGRGDAGKFAPGAVIDLFVAGVRDGDVWRMQVVGKEEIRLIDGATLAWHIVRQPRPGSYEQRLDIWLDPDRQWYPARLRFTETNGDYLEMSLTDLKSTG